MKSNPEISDDVKALVFDCDGTLLDTMPVHWTAWCKICKETGLVFKKDDFYTLAGVPGKKIIRTLAKEQDIKLEPLEVYERKRRYYLEDLATAKIIPCVVRYAKEAYTRGIPIAVASGSSREIVEQALELSGIRNMFDVVLGNEDYYHHKPSPDAFLTAARKLNVRPEDCWGLEDTNIGLESIHRAGFAKAIDVRLLDGYPMRADRRDSSVSFTEESLRRYRAFTS